MIYTTKTLSSAKGALLDHEYLCSIYVKNGKRWEFECAYTDKTYVLGKLAEDLIHKKLNQCTYIRSIKREPRYDGTQTITVLYDNGVKTVYDIPDSLY